MNIRILLNRSPEDSNNFRRYFQEYLRAFTPRDEVWKAKLQSLPDLSKVGFIMYIANTLQINILVNNVLAMIKQEIGPDI